MYFVDTTDLAYLSRGTVEQYRFGRLKRASCWTYMWTWRLNHDGKTTMVATLVEATTRRSDSLAANEDACMLPKFGPAVSLIQNHDVSSRKSPRFPTPAAGQQI